jgi:hypothetical protein
VKCQSAITLREEMDDRSNSLAVLSFGPGVQDRKSTAVQSTRKYFMHKTISKSVFFPGVYERGFGVAVFQAGKPGSYKTPGLPVYSPQNLPGGRKS